MPPQLFQLDRARNGVATRSCPRRLPALDPRCHRGVGAGTLPTLLALTLGPLAASQSLAMPHPHPAGSAAAARVEARGPEPATPVALDSIGGAISEFYRERGFAPVWVEAPGRVGAVALLRAIDGAGDHGLDPAAYHTAPLREILLAPEPVGPDRLARLDRLMSDAFVMLAEDLGQGRLDPVSDDRWFIRPEPVDGVELLRRASGSGALGEALAGLVPGHPGYRRLSAALTRYRAIAAAGGWPALQPDAALVAGGRGPAVAELRRRLALEDELAPAPAGSDPEAFDPALQQALRAYQARHGLAVDGQVGPATLRALNLPVAERLRQMALTLERWRWLPRDLGERHVLVNIAGFEVLAVDNGEVTARMRAIVGRRSRSTPAFSHTITHVVVNPAWNVPLRIAVSDLLPKIRRSPDYLERQHFQVLEDWSADARLVDPAQVDWPALDPAAFPYRLRQRPGPDNALGRIKFLMPNRHAVYLHDTPQRHLFEAVVRGFSSGCVRLESAESLARWALRDRPDGAALLDLSLAGEATRWLRLPRPLPVHLVYLTVWVDEQGGVHFWPDLYGRDRRVLSWCGDCAPLVATTVSDTSTSLAEAWARAFAQGGAPAAGIGRDGDAGPLQREPMSLQGTAAPPIPRQDFGLYARSGSAAAPRGDREPALVSQGGGPHGLRAVRAGAAGDGGERALHRRSPPAAAQHPHRRVPGGDLLVARALPAAVARGLRPLAARSP